MSNRTVNAAIALASCLEILQAIRPDYFRAVHGNQGGCDFDIEVCEQCGAAGDPPEHSDGCFAEKLDAAIQAADDALASGLAVGDTPLSNGQTMDELAQAEREHLGDPDKGTGVYGVAIPDGAQRHE